MTASPREPTLNRSATIVVGFCVALLVGTATVLVVPGLRTRVVPPVLPTSGYAAGEQVDLPGELFDAARTVVVFGQGACATCQQWAPSLSRLVAELTQTPQVRVLLVVDSAGTNPSADDGFARALGVDDSAVRRIAFRSLRLKAVPTLVVVERGGRIRLVSAGGVLDEHRTDELLKGIRGNPAPTARAETR